MLDLSENALTGTLEGAFDLYYCEESTNSGVCRTAGFKVGASTLTVLLLSSNYISGGLTEIVETLPLSLSVLTASDNLLEGLVPEEFSQLVVFFAGEECVSLTFWTSGRRKEKRRSGNPTRRVPIKLLCLF